MWSSPFFDPWDGGTGAEVLFLLEAPGPKATRTGFISMNNPDETAKDFFEAAERVGLERKRTVVRNTVPWYIGSGQRIRPADEADIDTGIESLSELLALLPECRGIVLVGRKAQKVARHVRAIAPHLTILTSPHPSPLFVNREPGNRAVLHDSFRAVKVFLDAPRGPDTP